MPSALFEFCATVSLPLLWTLFIAASLLSSPAFLLRWVVGRLARKVRPGLGPMVTGGDILFAEDAHAQDSKPHSVLLGYTTVEGGMTLQELQAKYLQGVVLSRNPVTGALNYPKFQQYFERWCGYSFWKWEESFSIEKHIRLLQNKYADEGCTLSEDDLLTLLGPLANQPFAKGTSPWEYLFVPSYLPKEGAAPLGLVIMRVHHSMGDGFSILKSFISYACGEGPRHDLLVSPASAPKNAPSAHKPSHNLIKTHLINWLNLACQLLTLPLCLLKHMVTLDRSPWFLPRGQLTGVCHLGLSRRIPVATVKRLSRQKEVSFSAILFSAVGGGVRRFCDREGGQGSIPQEIQCFTPFPRGGHPDNALVNHFSTAVIKLFPGEPSSDRRMTLNEVDLNEVKRSTFPLTMIWVMNMLAAFPTWYVHLVGANWFASTILSNFPGPRAFLSYFKTYRVPDIVFWSPHLNGRAGIGVSMLTYGDSLRFALNVDSAIIDSQVKVQALCNCIEEEIKSLLPTESLISAKPEETTGKIGEIESYLSAPAALRLRSVS